MLAARTPKLSFHPVTPERWPDLERLFGPRGACAGCWCMWWKRTRPEWQAAKGEENRRALRRIIRRGGEPGILAYAGDDPVGWCAVEPREAYSRLARSRSLAPVDDAEEVWSITCFFVARPWRGRGVACALIDAAVAHAKRRGAKLVEAYPIDARKRTADAFVYTGVASTFGRAGFEEIARRAPTRPIVRRRVR